MSEPIVVSYSELDTYRQCPLKHKFAYVERWKKPSAPGSALSRGSLWHLVLEDHYRYLMRAWDEKRMPLEADVVLEETRVIARKRLLDTTTGGYVSEDAELIDWMYQGHCEIWGADTGWRPVAVEYPFQLPLVDNNGRKSRYQIKGKIDLIMRDNHTGLLWILDHKSGAQLPSQMDLEIDDQFGLYTWAMRRLGYDVVGSIHSAAKSKRNLADFPGYSGKSKPQLLEDRFRRTLLNRTAKETEAIALDAWSVAYNAYPPSSKAQPLYSSPDPRQCGWKCDFKEIHLQSRQGGDTRLDLQVSGFVQDFTRHN